MQTFGSPVGFPIAENDMFGKLRVDMKGDSTMPPVDWAKRVNGTWLVRGGLDEAAEKWLRHLDATDPARLEAACTTARAMCGMRDPLADPKPWFYAGLFSVATRDETARFIPGHRVTKAAIPVMQGDPDVMHWLERVGGETTGLVHDLRGGLERLRRAGGIRREE